MRVAHAQRVSLAMVTFAATLTNAVWIMADAACRRLWLASIHEDHMHVLNAQRDTRAMAERARQRSACSQAAERFLIDAVLAFVIQQLNASIHRSEPYASAQLVWLVTAMDQTDARSLLWIHAHRIHVKMVAHAQLAHSIRTNLCADVHLALHCRCVLATTWHWMLAQAILAKMVALAGLSASVFYVCVQTNSLECNVNQKCVLVVAFWGGRVVDCVSQAAITTCITHDALGFFKQTSVKCWISRSRVSIWRARMNADLIGCRWERASKSSSIRINFC